MQKMKKKEESKKEDAEEQEVQMKRIWKGEMKKQNQKKQLKKTNLRKRWGPEEKSEVEEKKDQYCRKGGTTKESNIVKAQSKIS